MKLMTWLKIKTGVVVSVAALLIAGTTTVTVAQIQKQDTVADSAPSAIAATPSSNNGPTQSVPAQTPQTSSNPTSTSMDADEAKQKGIAALVNQEPIHWSEVDGLTATVAMMWKRSYSGAEYDQKIAEQRKKNLETLIENKLIIEAFKTSEPPLPDSLVNDQIDVFVKDQYGGSRENLLKRLAANGVSFDRYKNSITDYCIINYMHKKYAAQVGWMDGLKSKATIQIFDDPGQPDVPMIPAAQSTPHPLGIPVPDKPGFVKSPYAENEEPIDVHNYPPGSTVRCPYTGKIFIVPPAPSSH